MRVSLTATCLACLLFATTGAAQDLPAPSSTPTPAQPRMADCHPTSFGKLVDVTTVDGKTWQASIQCLDPQNVRLLRNGVVTSTSLMDVRRIVTRPDPVWDGFVKGAAIPLIAMVIFCAECLDDEGTYRAALTYGAIGATWDALQSNRKTIFDSGGRRSGVTASVSVPMVSWGGAPRQRR